MKTKTHTIGLDLLGSPPAVRAPARLALRFASVRASSATISALSRSVGDRKHHACMLDAAGGIVAAEVLANTAEVLTAFSQRYPKATCMMGVRIGDTFVPAATPRLLPQAARNRAAPRHSGASPECR
jgi:hypothetical protein